MKLTEAVLHALSDVREDDLAAAEKPASFSFRSSLRFAPVFMVLLLAVMIPFLQPKEQTASGTAEYAATGTDAKDDGIPEVYNEAASTALLPANVTVDEQLQTLLGTADPDTSVDVRIVITADAEQAQNAYDAFAQYLYGETDSEEGIRCRMTLADLNAFPFDPDLTYTIRLIK